jgi:hypothetical protein
MKLTIAIGLIFLVALPVLANDGIIPGQNPFEFEFVPPERDLIEAWNDDQPPAGAMYSGACFSFPYVPGVTYLLERVEFFAGTIAGQVTLEIWADDPDNDGPDGTYLGGVTYQESPPRDWQGANLEPAVEVTAGEQYWLVYAVVVGSEVTGSYEGVIIPHWWGDDCLTWSGPFDSLAWMARFYGYLPTPVQEGTWSTVKSLY